MGGHSVCVKCTPQEWFGRRKMRWTLAFDVLGENPLSGSPDGNLASVAHITSASASVAELIERVSSMSTENNYEKAFEIKFAKTSDAVNVDVAIFKIAQIVLIALVTG